MSKKRNKIKRHDTAHNVGRDYKELFQMGEDAVMKKLTMYDYKGDFPEDLDKIFEAMLGEINELDVELIRSDTIDSMHDRRDEAADVVAYGLMFIRACNLHIAAMEVDEKIEKISYKLEV